MTDSAHFKSGELQVINSDIKRFATDFDPQPFHLDEAAAAAWRWRWHAVRETADTLKKEGVKRSLASGFAGIDNPCSVATTPQCCPATPRR